VKQRSGHLHYSRFFVLFRVQKLKIIYENSDVGRYVPCIMVKQQDVAGFWLHNTLAILNRVDSEKVPATPNHDIATDGDLANIGICRFAGVQWDVYTQLLVE